jgi:hypothetical protein
LYVAIRIELGFSAFCQEAGASQPMSDGPWLGFGVEAAPPVSPGRAPGGFDAVGGSRFGGLDGSGSGVFVHPKESAQRAPSRRTRTGPEARDALDRMSRMGRMCTTNPLNSPLSC